jgi:hypothetical protein
LRPVALIGTSIVPMGLRTDAGISDAFDSSTLKAFRPVHSSKLHHLFLRLS